MNGYTQAAVRTIGSTGMNRRTLVADSLTTVVPSVTKTATKLQTLSTDKLPPRDIVTKNSCQFLLDNKCVCFRFDGSDWQYESKTVEKRSMTRNPLRWKKLKLLW